MEVSVSEQDNELRTAWELAGRVVPAPWQLGGVTYHGPQHPGPWIAFLVDAHGNVGGPEGEGVTAEDALEDLARKAASELSH